MSLFKSSYPFLSNSSLLKDSSIIITIIVTFYRYYYVVCEFLSPRVCLCTTCVCLVYPEV